MKSQLKKLASALPLLLVGMLFGFVIGFIGAQLMLDDSASPLSLLLLLIWFYLAMLVQIVIHESGHLIFGIASGYRFCSFRIGSVMISKIEGKLKLKRMSLAGTGGQCLLAPPEPDEQGDFPTALYNLGGSILNLITALIFAVLALVFREHKLALAMLAILALFGVAYAVLNGVPFRSKLIVNDGFNQLTIAKHPEAKAALAIQLKVVERAAMGEGLEEMPPEWFELPEKIGDHLTGTIAVFKSNRLIAEENYSEAANLIERLLTPGHEILPLHRTLMKLDLISLELIGENRRDKLEAMLTDELKKQIKSLGTNPSTVRCEYLLARLFDKDEKKAQRLAAKFEKLAVSYPYKQDIAVERRLMAFADTECSELKA